jgi:hypothetical protein
LPVKHTHFGGSHYGGAYYDTQSLENVLKAQCLLATEMNGKPLTDVLSMERHCACASNQMDAKATLHPSGKSPRLRTNSSPRYQPFDANRDQTTDWHLAASNRFCEIFDELLSTQKMLEVIPRNHAVEMSELLGT